MLRTYETFILVESILWHENVYAFCPPPSWERFRTFPTADSESEKFLRHSNTEMQIFTTTKTSMILKTVKYCEFQIYVNYVESFAKWKTATCFLTIFYPENTWIIYLESKSC